jgi:hypothetical protein
MWIFIVFFYGYSLHVFKLFYLTYTQIDSKGNWDESLSADLEKYIKVELF